ncbi:MAG: glycosyl hydrolase [Gemmatimonadetes bacterium]|nr:glycosyl hydrolase [Gemmatimonadota bacterium]
MRMLQPYPVLTVLVTVGIVAPGPLPAQQARGPSFDSTHFQALQWRNIGPHRGGRSVAVAGVRGQPQVYYFGGTGGGVWKTDDAGETWRNVSDGFVRTGSVGAIAVAESDPNVVFVGMGEHAVRGVATSHGDGVYRSTDGGKTWKHMGLDRTRAISRIRIHPGDPNIVYVAAQGAPYAANKERGVYRSKDGGATWQLVLFVSESAGASDLAMDATNPRMLYAAFWDHLRQPWQVRSGGPGSGIHKSADGGDTWEKITTGLPPMIGKVGVDVSRANPERVYAIVEADPGGGLFRSDDGGRRWTLMNSDWSIRARAWYYIEVFADPRNADVVYVLNAPFMKSIDGGRTFASVRVPHGDNHDLWISPDDSQIMINANDGGANVSFNGGRTWSTQENQPTAQFYRVNTDRRFPYHVYGGQQDNTTVGIASRTSEGGIGWKDWYDVGGCESGYVAFNPDDPRFVYAGCYMGQISEWDRATGNARDVMAYPVLPAALASRDMKYRFNWNAPIAVSPHNPNVIYHASNILLKSENRGRTWVEISPDLTRDDSTKQGPGGGPITNEGAGGEIYGTIFYVIEWPRERGVIWTGSDDGLVHVTRDGGANWANVTPREIGEAQINAIEVSPHDSGTAYLAVTKYKFNDFTPHMFKTTDYGRTWRRLVNGIEPEAWVRVVREDPVRRGLLYGGTETGFYVSFDGGERWQRLQLNLPVVPITDLQVRGNDLVAATSGRAFWALDDASPLRQHTEQAASAAARLYKPADAIRTVSGGFGGGGAPRVGPNPPGGAIVYYLLKEAADSTRPAKLEILDSAGAVIRAYATRAPGGVGGPGGPGGQAGPPGAGGGPALPARAGLNRFAWDLRHEQPTPVPGAYIFGALVGRRAIPGAYQTRLTVGDYVETQSFRVLPDPRVQAQAANLEAQDDLLASVTRDLSEIHGGVNRVRAVRDQVNHVMERAKDQAGAPAVASAGKTVVERLNAMEDSLIQKRTVDGQTVINFPMRLNQFYIYLLNAVDGADDGVTDGARRRHTDLQRQWAGLKATLDQLLGAELAAFNDVVKGQGIPAVVAPAAR